MSFDALRQTLETRMADNWASTPIAYNNVDFEPSTDQWVRFTVLTGSGETLGLQGSTVYVRDRGLVSLQIFAKDAVGTAGSMALADTFLTIFEHARFGGILTYTGSVQVVGNNNGWHQTNVTIPFRRVRNV